MHDERPTWLIEPCPPWCAAEHRQGDHPDDRVHRGASTTLAGFLAHGAVPTEFEEEPAHLVVHVMRPVGGTTTWVEVRETEGAGRGPVAAGPPRPAADADRATMTTS